VFLQGRLANTWVFHLRYMNNCYPVYISQVLFLSWSLVLIPIGCFCNCMICICECIQWPRLNFINCRRPVKWEGNHEWWIHKDLKGNDRGLVQGMFPEFVSGFWPKPQMKPRISWTGIRTSYFPNTEGSQKMYAHFSVQNICVHNILVCCKSKCVYIFLGPSVHVWSVAGGYAVGSLCNSQRRYNMMCITWGCCLIIVKSSSGNTVILQTQVNTGRESVLRAQESLASVTEQWLEWLPYVNI
jgi:hypothetical protein